MRISNKAFLEVNSIPVDLDIKFDFSKVNLIVGENGIGKTSLAKKLTEKNSNIFLCFQHRLSSVNATRVDEMLNMLIDNKYVNSDILKLIDYFSCSLLGKEVNSLSGGENQILKIAIALSQKREIVIFDEPSQYLDQSNLELFKKALLKRRSKKIILIEHNKGYLNDVDTETIKMTKLEDRIEVLND